MRTWNKYQHVLFCNFKYNRGLPVKSIFIESLMLCTFPAPIYPASQDRPVSKKH